MSMRVPRLPPLLALMLVMSACGQPDPGTRVGTGRLDGGDQVRAVETTGRTGARVLGLTIGRIRACSGSYPPPTLASPSRTTDLACTGGVTGTATVGPDLLGGRTVRWELETGETGRTSL